MEEDIREQDSKNHHYGGGNRNAIAYGNEFKKAFNQVKEKAWKNHNIDMDIDGHHETILILSKKFGFKYERKKK